MATQLLDALYQNFSSHIAIKGTLAFNKTCPYALGAISGVASFIITFEQLQ